MRVKRRLKQPQPHRDRLCSGPSVKTCGVFFRDRARRGAAVGIGFLGVGMDLSLRTARSVCGSVGGALGARGSSSSSIDYSRSPGRRCTPKGPGAVGDPKGGVEAQSTGRPSRKADGVGLLGVCGRAALLHVRRQGSQPRARGAPRAGQDIVTSLEVLWAAARGRGRWLPLVVATARCSSASAVSSRACEESPVAVARPSLVGL